MTVTNMINAIKMILTFNVTGQDTNWRLVLEALVLGSNGSDEVVQAPVEDISEVHSLFHASTAM